MFLQKSYMPSLLNKILCAFALLTFFFVPQMSFAATTPTTCTCFCGNTTDGAKESGSNVTDGTACAAICKSKGTVTAPLSYVGCYRTEDLFPKNNDKCWTQDECYAELTAEGFTPTSSSFGGQSPYCSKLISATTGYCYGKSKPTKLNVPVLGRIEVSSLPEYIDLMYRFLIPAMSLVAVTMLMIGGLQYATARGNSKAVSEAKTRITNALTGLVLLFAAFAIANFIDPKLTSLAGLRVPLIKQNVLLESDTTCESLRDQYGFVIEPSSGACGKTGRIKNIDNVKPEAANSNFHVGSSCDFSTCANGTTCFSDGESNSCLSCTGVPSPSVGGCSAFAERANSVDGDDNHQYYCTYYNATTALETCREAVTTGKRYLDCKAVLAAATDRVTAGTDPCGVYNDVNLGTTSGSIYLAQSEDTDARKVCTDDPCHVAELKLGKCTLTVPGEDTVSSCGLVK